MSGEESTVGARRLPLKPSDGARDSWKTLESDSAEACRKGGAVGDIFTAAQRKKHREEMVDNYETDAIEGCSKKQLWEALTHNAHRIQEGLGVSKLECTEHHSRIEHIRDISFDHASQEVRIGCVEPSGQQATQEIVIYVHDDPLKIECLKRKTATKQGEPMGVRKIDVENALEFIIKHAQFINDREQIEKGLGAWYTRT